MTKSKVWNVVFVLVIGILSVMLFLQRCSPDPVLPVKTVAQQQQVAKVDSIASKAYKDSVRTVMAYKDLELAKANRDWVTLANQYNDLQLGMTDLLNTQVPDSCKDIQDRLRAQFLQVVNTGQLKDSAHNQIIQGKDDIIKSKDVLLDRATTDFSRLRSNLDTCFKQQTILTAINKSLQPRRSVIAGISSMVWPNLGIGFNLGLLDRKGRMFEGGIMLFKNSVNYSISYKKTLFKF